MPFQYKKVLVIGATSGIGHALASRFVQEGSYVIVVGRRKEKLEEFVHEHGKEKSSAVPFDITQLEKIPNFVTKYVLVDSSQEHSIYFPFLDSVLVSRHAETDSLDSIIKTHTDLDCILLNSGIQRGFDFSKPETIDLSVVQEEFMTNYLSYLALTNAFLPFLKEKKGESALI